MRFASASLILFILMLTSFQTVIADSDSLAEKIKNLELKIQQLEESQSAFASGKNLNKNSNSVFDTLKVSGFITAAASESTDHLGTRHALREDVNMRGDSRLGVQLNYALSDKAEIVIQFIARSYVDASNGHNDAWGVDPELAYIRYEFSDHWSFDRFVLTH